MPPAASQPGFPALPSWQRPGHGQLQSLPPANPMLLPTRVLPPHHRKIHDRTPLPHNQAPRVTRRHLSQKALSLAERLRAAWMMMNEARAWSATLAVSSRRSGSRSGTSMETRAGENGAGGAKRRCVCCVCVCTWRVARQATSAAQQRARMLVSWRAMPSCASATWHTRAVSQHLGAWRPCGHSRSKQWLRRAALPPGDSHELARDMRLTPLPWERLRASEARPVSRRLPGSFHTSRKASPMFLLAAPPCSDTCVQRRQPGGHCQLQANRPWRAHRQEQPGPCPPSHLPGWEQT